MAQYATFLIAGDLYGIEVERVQEVLSEQPRTRVPLGPPAVAGLINLRGQVVTALELRERLQVPPREPGATAMNVVVRVGDDVVSLLVDAIGDVVETTPDTFEAPPDTLTGERRRLLTGAYKLPGRLLLALDVDRAATVAA